MNNAIFLSQFSVIISLLLIHSFNLSAQHTVDTDWVKIASGSRSVSATASHINALGENYVTGIFEGTVDFDPGVDTLNLTSGSPTSRDVFIQKFDIAGNLIWAKSFGGTHIDESTDICTDSAGNIYITGYYYQTSDFDPGPNVFNMTANGSVDAFVVKLDANGDFLLAFSIGGTGGGWAEKGTGIRVDAQNNMYITGNFSGTIDLDLGLGQAIYSTSRLDMYILKMDANLNYIWSKVMEGSGLDYAQCLELDAFGNIYLAGHFGAIFNGTVDFDPSSSTFNVTTNGNLDIFVQKLDPMGNLVWVKTIGGYDNDYLEDLCLTPEGDIYVTGSATDSLDMDPGLDTTIHDGVAGGYLLKLDNNGNYIWSHNFSQIGHQCITDSDGYCYLLGNFSQSLDFDLGPNVQILTSLGSSDIYILKLDANGDFVWVKSFGGSFVETGNALAIDEWSNLYISGGYYYTCDFDIGPDTLNYTAQGFLMDMYHLKLTQQVVPINKLDDKDFFVKIFPNPTQGTVFIELEEKGLQVSLFDLNGVLLLYRESFDNNIKLDISNYPPSSYFLRINDGQRISTKKIIVL